MRAGRMLSPDEFWARMRAHDEQLRALSATQQTYELETWTGLRMVDEWSFGGSTYRSLRFSAAGIEVIVATSNDLDQAPVRHLLLNLPTSDSERFTNDAKSRAHFERSRRPATGSAVMSVSGSALECETWTEDGFALAGAVFGGVGIGLRTNGSLNDVRLVLANDIEPYIRGRNDQIRAMRAKRGLDD